MESAIAAGAVDTDLLGPDQAARRPAGLPGPLSRLVPSRADPGSYSLVVVAALAQAATVLLTWDLWHHRSSPPNLPVVEALAAVPWALPLLAGTAAAVLRPRAGSVAFCALLLLALLGDQTRMQPEVISLAILMTAPAFGHQGRSVARWHLAALWLWAGLHKALSLGWATGGAAFVASSLRAPSLRPAVAVLLPAAEIGLGLLALSRRTWRAAAWGGLAFHFGILFTLAVLAGWNSAVWPWNAALAVAALGLFRPPDRPAPTPAAKAVAAAILLYPALFYAGLADAYPSHNLYTSNTPHAAACDEAFAWCVGTGLDTWRDLNVPLPPEPRLYRQAFEETCAPGTTLRVTGRATRFDNPPAVSYHRCPAGTDVGPSA